MILWSPSTHHFYHASLHGAAVPADAVAITPRRHRELLDGQTAGRAIMLGKSGKPELARVRKPTSGQLLATDVAAIKAEARRRILAVASLERQINDNALIAMPAGKPATGELDGALDRRAKIDAIRAASNLTEATIADWAPAALTAFDATAATWWPEWSDR